jgi:hypothetical protein
MAASSASSSSPARCRTRAWAGDPRCRSREPPVEVRRLATARRGRRPGPPANRPPHRLSPGTPCSPCAGPSPSVSSPSGARLSTQPPGRAPSGGGLGRPGRRGDEHDRVIPGDRAEDVGRPAWSMAEARKFAAPGGVRRTTRLAEAAADTSSSWQRCTSRASTVGRSGAGREGAVTALAWDGIHQLFAHADPLGADLDEVARQRGLGDLETVSGEHGQQLALRMDGRAAPRISTIRCWRAARDRATVTGCSAVGCSRSQEGNTAFCAWRRFSASSQTTLAGPSITSAATSKPRYAGRQCRKIAPGAASAIASAVTAERHERGGPLARLVLHAHGHPGVGGDDVGPLNASAGSVVTGPTRRWQRRCAAHRPRSRHRAGTPPGRRLARACPRSRSPAGRSCPCCWRASPT